MSETLTCIMCPVSCELNVIRNDDGIQVEGSQCGRGVDFAEEEILHPKRNLATSIPISGKNFRMLSILLSDRVSRHLLMDILKEIAVIRIDPPVYRGQVLADNILNSGADVIATRTVE